MKKDYNDGNIIAIDKLIDKLNFMKRIVVLYADILITVRIMILIAMIISINIIFDKISNELWAVPQAC